MPKSGEAHTDSANGPQTCCSTCRTVFEVAVDLLHSADTRVRCGECYAIFDALANLVDDRALPMDRDAPLLSRAVSGGRGGGDTVGDAAGPRTAGAASLAGLANDTAAMDVTYSDFDLFSEDAELPEVAYLDQTRDTPEFDFDSVELDDDESFSDTLFLADMTLDASRRVPVLDADDPRAERLPPLFASDDARPPRSAEGVTRDEPVSSPPSPVSGAESATGIDPEPQTDADASARIALDFQYQDPEPEPLDTASEPVGPLIDPPVVPEPSASATALPEGLQRVPRRRSWGLIVTALCALLVLLGALHGYRQRAVLHEDPLTRPVYEAFCRVSGCEVPLRRSLDRIELLERQMFSHPTLSEALVIDVAFRNAARFEQALPALSVRLSDRSGRLVARRTFQPVEYLADGEAPSAMAPGARLRVSLDVDDPGSDASSFVIAFVPADTE